MKSQRDCRWRVGVTLVVLGVLVCQDAWGVDVLPEVGPQGHTFGMAQWIPYFGTGVSDTSDCVVRSQWCPWLGIGRDQPQREALDWTDYHRMVGQRRRVCDYMLGDYYPLPPAMRAADVWLAWKLHRPDLDEGLVLAFRRKDCPQATLAVKLRGLTADKWYTVTWSDAQDHSQA